MIFFAYWVALGLLVYAVFFVFSYSFIKLVPSKYFSKRVIVATYFWAFINLMIFAILLLVLDKSEASKLAGTPFEIVAQRTKSSLEGELFSVFLLPIIGTALLNMKLFKNWSDKEISTRAYFYATGPLCFLIFMLSSPISALFLYNSRFIVGYLLYPYKFLIEFSA